MERFEDLSERMTKKNFEVMAEYSCNNFFRLNKLEERCYLDSNEKDTVRVYCLSATPEELLKMVTPSDCKIVAEELKGGTQYALYRKMELYNWSIALACCYIKLKNPD